jgi:hypothetical protein
VLNKIYIFILKYIVGVHNLGPVSSLCSLSGRYYICLLSTEAKISKNYYPTNSGSPEVELRFSLWLILFKY